LHHPNAQEAIIAAATRFGVNGMDQLSLW
jgi:hypothetical protein